MIERRDARIEEVDGGYIVRLEWEWRENRDKDSPAPIDRKKLFTDLSSALSAINFFLQLPLDRAIEASRK